MYTVCDYISEIHRLEFIISSGVEAKSRRPHN